jgi:hypothetical protein
MRERVTLVSGEVSIRSEEGAGTVLRALVPARRRPQREPAEQQAG